MKSTNKEGVVSVEGLEGQGRVAGIGTGGEVGNGGSAVGVVGGPGGRKMKESAVRNVGKGGGAGGAEGEACRGMEGEIGADKTELGKSVVEPASVGGAAVSPTVTAAAATKTTNTNVMAATATGPRPPIGMARSRLEMTSVQDSARWLRTMEHAIVSTVSIRFAQPVAFDTEPPASTEASGIIVDSERGLVLTNRHVVGSGPFLGEMVCDDHEEVTVWARYRDPIHDFGFLRFDPKEIKYMPVRALPLRPDLAAVGLDVRVIGNDAGEKLSILAGSISRLDRTAPNYGDMTYNDFNSFYIQAAISASGGSSGSPVLDIEGNVVALQSGGSAGSATDWFFPLDRVKRALELIQKEVPVTRGSIQVEWLHQAYDEVRRLGLREETEAVIRREFPEGIGMLVAETVLPGGPAAGLLEEGDVLVKVNGKYVTQFVPLEDVLDNSVGGTVELDIERGSVPMRVSVVVQDLHTLMPSRYVQIGGTVLNDLSYQLARNYCIPVSGVYIAEAQGMFEFESEIHGWMVHSVDHMPTPNLDAFIDVMKSIPDRKHVPIVYYSIADLHTKSVAIVAVDRHWTRLRMAERDDVSGLWTFTDLGDPKPPLPLEPKTASFPDIFAHNPHVQSILRSLVKINFYAPVRLDGHPNSHKRGSGVVVDHVRGLIIVSKSVVPFDCGDLHLTFADSIVILGKVLFVHPHQNITLVKYDPALLGNTPVTSVKWPDEEQVSSLKQGSVVELVALNRLRRPVHVTAVVTDVAPTSIPISTSPRARAVNFDAITLDSQAALYCPAGVLANSRGEAVGLWMRFLSERDDNGHDSVHYMGIPSNPVRRFIQTVVESNFWQSSAHPLPLTPAPLLPLPPALSLPLRRLSIECKAIGIVKLRYMGLPEPWLQRLERTDPERKHLFLIQRVEVGTPCASKLAELDVILDINGTLVTRMEEFDRLTSRDEVLRMTILREEKIMEVEVETLPMEQDRAKRFVIWAGALVQEPHIAVLQQSKHLPSRCYISTRARGSPADYGLVPTQWIVRVNNMDTPDLDSFVEAVKKCRDNNWVRVKVVSFDNIPGVVSIKTNYHYWPTIDVVKDPTDTNIGWAKRKVECAPESGGDGDSVTGREDGQVTRMDLEVD